MKLLHVSFWFGKYPEPVEWAWFPQEDLGWIQSPISEGIFKSIYNDEAMVIAIL